MVSKCLACGLLTDGRRSIFGAIVAICPECKSETDFIRDRMKRGLGAPLCPDADLYAAEMKPEDLAEVLACRNSIRSAYARAGKHAAGRKTGEVQARILEALAPGRWIGAADVLAAAGTGVSSARRALRRLVSRGIVVRASVGDRVRYALAERRRAPAS
jgi:ribosomal protein S25